MPKALGLLSGGLDSTLAAVLLRRQGIDVTCIAFVTPFFGAGRARKAADALGLPLLVEEIGEPHLEMVKNPRYGYGRNLNPCIDCHAMMFRRAGRIMEERGFDFLFSGEVLGQRPMSQNLSALQAVNKHSGYPGKILRPLSARLLPITPMEESGLVDREQLLDIQGRTRRRQTEYARAWGVVDYPSSGGGCLLTEPRFTVRLRDLLTHDPDADVAAVERLKIGRHYRLSPHAKLILGRDQGDNERIEQAARPDDLLLRAEGVNGPLGMIDGEADAGALELAAAIVATYGRGAHLPAVTIRFFRAGTVSDMQVKPTTREAAHLLIL